MEELTCRKGIQFINVAARRHKETAMGILVWMIVGGIIGWLASLVMRADGQQGVLLNMVVGVVGAFLGGWVISPFVGVGTINQGSVTIGSIVVSLVGAIILLAIVNLFRRGRVR